MLLLQFNQLKSQMMHENDRHHIIWLVLHQHRRASAVVMALMTDSRVHERSLLIAISIKLTAFNSWESEIKSFEPENFFPLRHSID